MFWLILGSNSIVGSRHQTMKGWSCLWGIFFRLKILCFNFAIWFLLVFLSLHFCSASSFFMFHLFDILKLHTEFCALLNSFFFVKLSNTLEVLSGIYALTGICGCREFVVISKLSSTVRISEIYTCVLLCVYLGRFFCLTLNQCASKLVSHQVDKRVIFNIVRLYCDASRRCKKCWRIKLEFGWDVW